MNTKIFNSYLDEATRDLNRLRSNPTKTEIYEYALQKIKERYDYCIENEVSKYRRNIKIYSDNLFENLKTEIRKEMCNNSES